MKPRWRIPRDIGYCGEENIAVSACQGTQYLLWFDPDMV